MTTISIRKTDLEALESEPRFPYGDPPDALVQVDVYGQNQNYRVEREAETEFYSRFLLHTREVHCGLKVEFQELAAKWHADTDVASSTIEKVMHPAYLRIISLGKPALPLILQDFREQPSQWFTALETISGADPVPVGCYDMEIAVNAWLGWGRANNYLP